MKEKTIIDAIIDHSRAIYRYHMFLEMKRRFAGILARTPDLLPTEINLKESLINIDAEARRRIAERNEACKKYLTQMIDTKKYGFTDRFYFSLSELKDGYVLLQENFINKQVLFLSNHEDFNKGDVIDFYKCEGELLNIIPALRAGDLTFEFLTFNKNQV